MALMNSQGKFRDSWQKHTSAISFQIDRHTQRIAAIQHQHHHYQTTLLFPAMLGGSVFPKLRRLNNQAKIIISKYLLRFGGRQMENNCNGKPQNTSNGASFIIVSKTADKQMNQRTKTREAIHPSSQPAIPPSVRPSA